MRRDEGFGTVFGDGEFDASSRSPPVPRQEPDMIRSLFLVMIVPTVFGAFSTGAFADQMGGAATAVHTADEALQAAPGANVVHGGSISFAGGTAQVLAFDFGTESPRDIATGQASGKRQWGSVTIVRKTDSASPLLFQALAGGTVGLIVGAERYMLHGVSVVSSKHVTVTGPRASDTQELERISFTFQKIEVSNVNGGKSATDNWLAPGAPTPSPSPRSKP